MLPNEDTQQRNRLLTIDDLLMISGYKAKSSIYRLMKQGQCPSPVTIGGNQVRWRNGDIEDWLNNLPTRKY